MLAKAPTSTGEGFGEWEDWFWKDAERPERPEDPIRWYEIPTNNPINTEVRNFVNQVENWKNDGRITEEEARDIMAALNDKKTLIYLNLLAQQNFLTTFVIRADYCAAAGLQIKDVAPHLSIFEIGTIIELVRMVIRNIHIQIAGYKLPFKERQIAAIGGMTFGIGGQVPWIMLAKYIKNKYPHIFKYFKLYFRGRKFYNILSEQQNGEPRPFTKKEGKYLSALNTKKDITPENIAEMERIIFQDLLTQVEKPNIPSVNPKDNTFAHAKAYGGIC